MQKHSIGLIVNPLAGMGGSVGLKGTDGEMYQRALSLGAQPISPKRTHTTLKHIQRHAEITWLTAPGEMGAQYLAEQGLVAESIGAIEKQLTAAQDTRRIAQAMLQAGAELLVFVGGDGTARDIFDAIGTQIPVVAVPAGVKIYSSVFSLNPRAAARLIEVFINGCDLTEQEVLDIDEDAYRAGRLNAKLHGYLLVPHAERFLQAGKQGSAHTTSSLENKKDIAASIVEDMAPATLYLLGPGTTVKAITDHLDLPKTLLGVDALYERTLIGRDLNAQAILKLLDTYPQRHIIVTPLGGNGFIFGRGNKQFTPQILRRVGKGQIRVVSTGEKLRQVQVLRVDTGDEALDETLSGYIEVSVGYHAGRVIKVTHGV